MPEVLSTSLHFFISTFTELLELFVVITMLVLWLQQKFPAEKIQALLSGGSGYLSAAALGAITPFCSCSTLPMLTGMLKARADFGPVMTFLFTSPLLNPMLVALLLSVFGWKMTLVYSAAVLSISLLSGYLLASFRFERYVTLTPSQTSCCNTTNATAPIAATQQSTATTHLLIEALRETRKLLPHLVLAVLVGTLIHGYVPTEFFSQFAGELNGWMIPFAAVLGIPLYVRASSMIPLALSLVAKGLSYGSVMALTISGAGASLPELIILKRIFHWPLLLAFIGVVFSTACLTGFAIDAIM
jgi:uncharacterized membrane protein YraQ (UPF0718 family)